MVGGDKSMAPNHHFPISKLNLFQLTVFIVARLTLKFTYNYIISLIKMPFFFYVQNV